MNPFSYELTVLEAIDDNGPSILLAEHHRSLRRAGEDLMGRCHEDNSLAVIAEFRVFERQVLEHMRLEEEIVVPAFAEVDPDEAVAILDAHRLLRKQLERGAVDIERHSLRLPTMRGLLDALDDHAKREDSKMYPWAQIHLPAKTRDAIGERMFASMRRLAKLAIR
jgi:hypothetical protein